MEAPWAFIPFVIAPAERCRATGGTLEPSRCHGARVCLSSSCAMAISSFDDALLELSFVGSFVAGAFLPSDDIDVEELNARNDPYFRFRNR